MRTLRSSELGTYLYCQRSWWYQQQGIESQNASEMAGGTQLHQAHGQKVLVSGLLKLAGWLLLLAGLVLAIYTMVSQLV
jgi:CRISPR/Cas system-associated exonuclease Cas4 (RecB family)